MTRRDRTGEPIEQPDDDDVRESCGGSGWLDADTRRPCPECRPWLVALPHPRPPTKAELAHLATRPPCPGRIGTRHP